MTRNFLFLFLMIGVIVVGCSQAPILSGATYTATVEKLETPEGVFFTTTEGSAPFSYFLLRLHDNGKPGANVVRVHVLDRIDPKKYGGLGDVVSFRFEGPLPDNEGLPFEKLEGYRIVSRGKNEPTRQP